MSDTKQPAPATMSAEEFIPTADGIYIGPELIRLGLQSGAFVEYTDRMEWADHEQSGIYPGGNQKPCKATDRRPRSGRLA